MACEYIWEPEGVHKRFSGFVTSGEFIQSVEKTQRDFRFDDAKYVIDDFSGVSGQDISEDALTLIAAINYGAYASNPNCRIAYVTNDLAFADLINDTLASCDMVSYQVAVRPTLADARAWLDSQPRLHNVKFRH